MKYLIYDKIRLGVAVLLCFCTALQTDAKVKLPALISDGMVNNLLKYGELLMQAKVSV